MKRVEINQDADQPVAAEVLASAIVRMDAGVKAALSAGLKKATVVTLVHDQTKIPKRDIAAVLDALTDLRSTWTTR